ncbi:MAG TPA: hypothetical protein VHC69_02375 [Polyangiaceae bacterium]|nr:hypothetical protein [Polyangiaceae bacterium]
MSEFELHRSLEKAAARVGRRRPRADRGRSRLPPAVDAQLTKLLARPEIPRIAEVHAAMKAFCGSRGLECPSRATIYNALRRVTPPFYRLEELPKEVQRCLHNVDSKHIPGHQVVLAAFNHGDARALSYAAGMPWACLLRAYESPGSRPKSRALLRAVLEFRGIAHGS